MNRFKRRLPEGVQDYMPGECGIKREIEAKLAEVFYSEGFDMVEPPSFEYYDVFSSGVGSYFQEDMIKFFDLAGRILVLRPDLTVPIARMVSTYAEDEGELRLSYIGNAYAQAAYNMGQRAEFSQAGIELIGREDTGADAETVALAIRSILAVGIEDFKLDIGHVGLFNGIIKEAGIDEETAERIRSLIDAKNTVELEFMLTKAGIAEEYAKRLLALPELFGGEETFERARQISCSSECDAAIADLEEIYGLLCDFGYKNYISLDLFREPSRCIRNCIINFRLITNWLL